MWLLHLSAVFGIFITLLSLQAVNSNPCNGTSVNLTGTSGNISSPNYPNSYGDNLNCVWRIETPENTRIAIRFEENFTVEWSGSTCNYDYIEFDSPLRRLCGWFAPTFYVSATNVLMVTFWTDEFITRRGFSFNWTAIDASVISEPVYTEIGNDEGTISSPNYPDNYPAFSNYTWKLNVTKGKSILLEFNPTFDLEQSEGCSYDNIAISETSTPFAYYDRLYICQFVERKVFYTNVIYIQFESDSINSGKGFSFNYKAIDDPPTCDGITLQNGTSGIIESPEYPGKYPANLDCTWHVTTEENTVIAVRFNTNFSLVTTGACFFEYLEVFDGPDTSPEHQFQHKFCEPWAPRSFVTTGNALTVRFVSSGFGDFSHFGFSIKWMTEKKCNSDEFTCWDGACISESNKCDGTMNCPNDIADEASCPKDSAECGIPEVESEFKWHSRIVGGYEAAKGSWPWQGHLGVIIGGDEIFLCGCVLISERWVLTAAHCIFSGVEKSFVTFGDHDRTTSDGDEQVLTVEKTFVHPQYNWTDSVGFIYGYDIALLYLEAPVNFTKWVKPVCFPKYEPKGGELVIRTGWGRTKFQGPASPVLRQVVAPVVTKEECSRLNEIPNLSDSLLCVGLPFGGASTCSGDSGGPVVMLQNGTWVVVGLTSFGTFCGETNVPSGYTNVYNLRSWINGVMANGLKEIESKQIVISGRDHGIISSPNYGIGNYEQGFFQRWYIIVAEGKLIQIRFSDPFRIHQHIYGEPCGGDYLIIYDGGATSSRKYGDKKLCGYSRPLDMESTTNIVIVEFSSNYDFEELGFSLTWTAVDDCASNEFRCWDHTCSDSSKKCDGFEDCPSKVDEFVCAHATPGSTECGKTEIAPKFPFSPLIIGGYNAEKGSWPWQVAIYVLFGSSELFYCGGTLVSESWVLTGANCIVGSRYQVVIGGYNKSYESALLENRLINVAVAFQHIGYDAGLGRQSRFGMMKLATPVDLTSKWYKPVCLPTNDTIYPTPGSKCVITGWGKTGPNDGNPNPDILQQLQINVLSDEECYGGDPTVICAGYVDRDAGICLNDIGGPLVCQQDKKWVQYGIASFSIGGCGNRAVFEKVSLHTNAIVDIINNLEVCKALKVIEGVTSGEIAPPVVGGEYLQPLECSWLIRGPSNTLINIKFEFFETEDCDFLPWDFVNVYDGNSTAARRVYDTTLCGDLEGLNGFESSSNELLIYFFSDLSIAAKGFKIHFSIVEDCNLNQFRCWNGTCIDASLQCDGKSDCYDESDEKECPIRDGQCGKQEIVPDFLWHARVVGGHYAKNGSWPFVVQIEDSYFEEFLCAGTIINDRWVLTLATPIQLMIAEELLVIVGTNELTPTDAVKYQVEEILFPSEFWMDYIGAVGLLKVTTSISFSATVQPACLSLPNITMEPQAGEHCVALGWGASIAGERMTGPLRQTLVPILSENICANKRIAGDWNRTFCSGESESGGTGACDYDRGGPVMCFRDNVWVQSGVITDSNSCGKFGVFEFYTRVSAYVNWIQMATNTKLPSHFEAATSPSTAESPTSTSLTPTTGKDMTNSDSTTMESTPTPSTASNLSETTTSSTTSGATPVLQLSGILLIFAILFQRIIRC